MKPDDNSYNENPLTVSISFLVCVVLFIPLFVHVLLEVIKSESEKGI